MENRAELTLTPEGVETRQTGSLQFRHPPPTCGPAALSQCHQGWRAAFDGGRGAACLEMPDTEAQTRTLRKTGDLLRNLDLEHIWAEEGNPPRSVFQVALMRTLLTISTEGRCGWRVATVAPHMLASGAAIIVSLTAIGGGMVFLRALASR